MKVNKKDIYKSFDNEQMKNSLDKDNMKTINSQVTQRSSQVDDAVNT